jgi:hypothetical protein
MRSLWSTTTTSRVLIASALSRGELAMWPKRVRDEDGDEYLLQEGGTWSAVAVPPAGNLIGTKDFRKMSWGMGMEEISALEPLASREAGADTLFLEGQIIGLSCLIVYSFAMGRLVSGRYVFTVEHSNLNHFISDYERLKDSLAKKYGRAVDDGPYWSNDLFQDSRQEWGTALSVGHVVYFCEWSTPKTKLLLMLRGDNHEINFSLNYSSTKYAHLEEEQAEAQAFEDL